MNPARRAASAHVFVDSLLAPELSDDDEHHLRRVLRIRPSDPITLCDGAGSWVVARLLAEGLSIESEVMSEPRPAPAVVLSAIPKGERLEWMVQKLTELGVTSLGLIDCARSVVRWDGDRAQRHAERLRRVAREAAMQSRRAWLPELCGVVPFASAAQSPTTAIADPNGEPHLPAAVDTVLIGPEGGFTAAELELVNLRLSLSHNVLRIETAALAAAVMLTLRHEFE